MKRAAPGSPVKNPKPTKSRSKAGGSSSVTTRATNTRAKASTLPPKGRVSRQLRTPDVSMTNPDDEDWEDEEVNEVPETDSDDGTPSPPPEEMPKPKRGRPRKSAGDDEASLETLAKPIILKLGAFKDLSSLTDAFLNSMAQVLKLAIINGRLKLAIYTARTEAHKSESQHLKDLEHYESTLDEIGLLSFQKARLERAIAIRIEKEKSKGKLEAENLELRWKLFEIEKASDKLSGEVATARTDAKNIEK